MKNQAPNLLPGEIAEWQKIVSEENTSEMSYDEAYLSLLGAVSFAQVCLKQYQENSALSKITSDTKGKSGSNRVPPSPCYLSEEITK